MPGLIPIDRIPAFAEVARISPNQVTDSLRNAVRELHEVHEIEDFLRLILNDRAATPHGPAEIVDILTHKMQLNDSNGLAAFVLKGRSYQTVRAKDVAHQIYRLEKIEDLHLAVFGATGVVLDSAKEQFSSTCKRLKIAYAFFDADDFARLFWAYGLMCPRDGAILRGGRCACGYVPGRSLLNIFQIEALKRLAEHHSTNGKRALVVLPTGAGKTRVAALDSERYGAAKVLYVAHSDEILEVAEGEFSAVFGTDSVRRITGKARTRAKVSLITIQLLSRHIGTILDTPFDYVIIDEFHHAAAKTYRKVVDGLDRSFLLGLTATPFRGDEQDIAQLCGGNILVSYDLRAGVQAGILSPYHYRGCFDEVDYSGLPIASGGYDAEDLERRLFIPERHRAIVEKWRERAPGKPTLAFCFSHGHARRIAKAFSSDKIPAAVYLSSTPLVERKRLVARLRSGDLKVLCTVDVLNEGADIPFVECLLFLRPTESKRIFLQQLGRGLRHSLGKSHCDVIDFIGGFQSAHRILGYHDLKADDFDFLRHAGPPRTARDVLDLPLNCEVTFDERVLDLFADQALDPSNARRTNIGAILIHRYQRLCRYLGRPATAKDVDRNEMLNSDYYKLVFGSWKNFAAIMRNSHLDSSG